MDAQSECVKNFYNALNVELNFKTNFNTLTSRVNAIVDQLSPTIKERYYGSGNVIPEHLKGARVLDLGCGCGPLVFILSKLVGPTGHIVGIDFCPGLIETARKESEYHYKKWGYEKANFEFHHGNIDTVTELGFKEGSFDVVVSNGVFCLCPDKNIPFDRAFRMLKPGGQFLLSDVYGEVPQPDEIKKQEKMWCLGIGCLLWNELSPMCTSHGFTSPYLQYSAGITIGDVNIQKQLNNAEYQVAIHRILKLPADAKRGPAAVTYLGNLQEYPDAFTWDIDLTFTKGQPVAVDAELATILAFSDFAQNFSFQDHSGDVTTKRNQNPFEHLQALKAKGIEPPSAYTVA